VDVAFSPDGKRIVSGSRDGTVKIWDAADGHVIHTFMERVHKTAINRVAFSPDGKLIASAGDDATVRLWDVATRQLIRDLKGHESWLFDVAFSPDGTVLASASTDQTARVWDLATGQCVQTFKGIPVQSRIAFSPDGSWLATASQDQMIKLWNVRTGEPSRQFVGNMARIAGLAFRWDGKRLASTGTDGTVKLWDVASGQEALLLRDHISATQGVAFSPDGFQLATGDNDCKGKLWDARPWTPEAAIEREAVGMLDCLFAKPLCKADVIDYLRNTPTIRLRARELALTLVDRYHDQINPETYHQASRALVRQPYLNSFQYRFALLQAEHACRLAPDQENYRLGLGAALYRAGRCREAVETLRASDRPDKASPVALAFLAMAHYRLGQREEARAVLAQLRQFVDNPHGSRDTEILDMIHEADALIACQVATTER
jgi:hypothetical protein